MNDYLHILLLPGSETLCLSVLFIVLASGRYRLAITLLFMCAFATLFNSYLKSIWQIPLPITANSNGWAFPSGHMHFACVFWLTLALSIGRQYFYAAIPLLVALGYALVAKGYHYPADIFPSALLGACEAYYANRYLSKGHTHSLPIIALGSIMFFLNPQNFTLLSVSLGALLALGSILHKVQNRETPMAFQLTVLSAIFIYSMIEILNFNALEHSRIVGTLFSAMITLFTWKILASKNQYGH